MTAVWACRDCHNAIPSGEETLCDSDGTDAGVYALCPDCWAASRLDLIAELMAEEQLGECGA